MDICHRIERRRTSCIQLLKQTGGKLLGTLGYLLVASKPVDFDLCSKILPYTASAESIGSVEKI